MLFSLIGQALFGWLLADLVTGTFHWWEDNFGSETWPVIGPWLIAPNRLHHRDPLAFTRHGFWDRNLAALITAGFAALALAWMLGPQAWIVPFAIGGGLANEVHRFAHQPGAAGPLVRMFQQTGAWQSPKGHATHHRPPHDRSYCILTDWLNPVLELLNFWTRLERLGRKEAT